MALSKVVLAAPVAAVALVAAQGAHVRRTALRLPEAETPDGDHGTGDEPLRLYVIGDSVGAAVGLDDHRDSLAGRLGDLLATDRAVRRTVLARSGFNAAETTEHVQGRLGDADVVVVSIGVNDTKDGHSTKRWRSDLTRLLESVVAQAPEAQVVLLGIPPMESFPALPKPLAQVLGARSRVMDRVGREVASRFPAVRRLELTATDLDPSQPDLFARDGFHPSATVHAAFATRIHALLEVGP